MSIQTCSRPCSRARRHVSTTFLNPFSVSAQPALQILQGDLIVAPNVREDGVAWDILTKNGPQLHCRRVNEAHVGWRVVDKAAIAARRWLHFKFPSLGLIQTPLQ